MKGERGKHHGNRPVQVQKADEPRIICGIHPVEELLRTAPKSVRQLLVNKNQPRAEVLAMAQSAGIAVRRVELLELDRLIDGGRHQGVVAIAEPFEYTDFDEAMKGLKDKPDALVVLLDSIQDPQNLGAIARSALAFGADLLVLPKDRAAQVTAAAEKSAAGAFSHLAVSRVVNLNRALDEVKEYEFWTVGAVTHGAKPLRGYDFPQRLALVIGAEGEGMRQQVRERIDIPLTIGISERSESLNASTAAAIFLHEMYANRTR